MTQPWRKAPIDPARLIRALRLRVRTINGRQHRVEGGESGDHHWVALGDQDCPACDCGDHTFRDGLCMHALAALLAMKDPRTCEALGRLVADAWANGQLEFLLR